MTSTHQAHLRRLVLEVQPAALQAQELLLAVQALDARLSGLTSDAPPQSIREAATLTRAVALQISGLLHGLIAESERMLIVTGLAAVPADAVPKSQ